METKSQLNKKRSLSYSLPKSNFTLEEQFYYIESTFNSLKDPIVNHILRLGSSNYEGLSSGKFSFYKTLTDKEPSIKVNTIYAFNYKLLNYILDRFYLMPMNRFLHFSIDNETIKISDPLLNFSEDLNKNELIYSTFENIPTSFYIDTRILFIFKLNKKTINKKTNIFLSENEIFFHIERKKQTFVCGYSFN